MIRFLMVYPRFRYPTGDPPIGPATIIAFLREKVPSVEFGLFDGTFQPSIDLLKKKIEVFRPGIIGIYCNTIMHDDVVRIARLGKSHGAFIVVGGPHATMVPDSLIKVPSIDAVVLGEGELPLLFLLNKFPSLADIERHPSIITKSSPPKKMITKDLERVDNLDAIPFPAYDLLDMNAYVENWFQMDIVSPKLRGTNVLVSRGCPFQCSFCQPTLEHLFGRKTRYRSPGKVVDELEFLKKRYGIRAFILTDDTPTFNKEWMLSFVETLKTRGLDLTWGCNTRVGLLSRELILAMKAVGFKRVMVGIESASQRILDDIYQKGIKIKNVIPFCEMLNDEGLKIFAYFMLGAPTEKKEDICRTIDLAFTLPIHEATFSITTPLPGTYLFDKMRSNGFNISRSFSSYDYYSSLVFDQGIKQSILRMYQRLAFMKFYLHPRRWPVLFRMVTSIQGIKKALLKIKRITTA